MAKETEERQLAELEFVQAAYQEEADEVCCSQDHLGRNTAQVTLAGCWSLQFTMPAEYPESCPIHLHVSVHAQCTNRKRAFALLSNLTDVCQLAVDECQGGEAILHVLTVAEEWIATIAENDIAATSNSNIADDTPVTPTILVRRLIYSHHIIAKQKLCDLHALAKELRLTGYLKIGWPGLLLVEGRKEDCDDFYQTIRQWNWKHLAVRGEQEILLLKSSDELDNARCFSEWIQVDDMSIVAQHCRQVGLENLFQTMFQRNVAPIHTPSQHQTASNTTSTTNTSTALIHVDHMNQPKAYRKWLRRVCHEHGVQVCIRQCQSIILVALCGEAIPTVLKQWRTHKVDVDGRGKPCLERQMNVLVQQQQRQVSLATWQQPDEERDVESTPEQLRELLRSLGGESWVDVVSGLL